MTSPIQFGRITVDSSSPAVIIAEVACEHQGDLESAKRLIESAHQAGADVVKFQLHLPEEEMISNSIRFWAGSMDDILARVNLPPEAHQVLMAHCEDVGIQYLCTPFCPAAADVLHRLGAVAFKIGSGEMTNIPMLRHVARKGKPMIVSTGMASIEEIEEAVLALREERAQFILMHCTSAYPPRYEQINLGCIRYLKDSFGVYVGYSDHTPEIWTAIGAVVMGAKVIEKHFTLDRALKGPDSHVSLEPGEFRIMVEAVRKLEVAVGSEKKIYPEEETVRRWAHHSVVSLRDIPAARVITPEMVGVKRPSPGPGVVPAKDLQKVVGKRTVVDIPANVQVKWEYLDSGD